MSDKQRADLLDPGLKRRTDKATALGLRLAHAENALHALTSGQVDSIVDPSGKIYLLRPAQEHLRQNERRLQELIESAADVITVVNREGAILSQSRAVRQVLGYEPEELVETSFFNLIHEEDLAAVHSAFFNVIEGFRENATAQFRHRTRDGTYRMIEATMGKLCGVSSASVVLSLRPITRSERAWPSVLDEPEAGADRKLTLLFHEGPGPLTEALLGIATLEAEIWIDSSKPAIEMIWREQQLEARVPEQPLDFTENGHLQGELLLEVPGTPSRPIDPLYILLVEDRSDAVLAGLLEGCGHAVFAAPDMLTGLALAENCRFDLVISDVSLPDGSGYELMERLRFTRPSLAGIAVSGIGMPSDIHQSLQAGFSEHLLKPVTLKSLQSAIQTIAA